MKNRVAFTEHAEAEAAADLRWFFEPARPQRPDDRQEFADAQRSMALMEREASAPPSSEAVNAMLAELDAITDRVGRLRQQLLDERAKFRSQAELAAVLREIIAQAPTTTVRSDIDMKPIAEALERGLKAAAESKAGSKGKVVKFQHDKDGKVTSAVLESK